MDLRARVEHAAAADWRQQKRQVEGVTENGGPQIDQWKRNGSPRPEGDVVEDPAVLAKRPLGFGAAVDVVEHHARQAAFSKPSQVVDVDDASGMEAVGHEADSLPDRNRASARDGGETRARA